MADEKFTLEYFLNLPLENAEPVMKIFSELEGAKYYPVSEPRMMDSFYYRAIHKEQSPHQSCGSFLKHYQVL